MRPPAIRCFGLTKKYGQVKAVYQVDLAVDQGELLVLLGPSGCGKTTLLRLMAGFEVPGGGTLAIGGQVMSGPNYCLPPDRRKVGMVFQEFALFPHLDVAGNVGYGLARIPERKARVREVLRLVGLEGLERRMPHELSGGEQQRVALARALAPRPDVVLLDEPFSNLDEGLRVHVRAEVRQILREAHATAVFVTHNQEEAMFLGDRIAVMNRGRLEQVDTPERIYQRPVTRFVAEFMEVADFLPARVEGDVLVTELGVLPRPPGVDQGEVLEVMVRPDDVSVRSDAGGEATVVERVFQGMHYLYTVRLPSGFILHSLHQHYQSHSVGARVVARLDPGHALICFVRGEIRSIPLMGKEP